MHISLSMNSVTDLSEQQTISDYAVSSSMLPVFVLNTKVLFAYGFVLFYHSSIVSTLAMSESSSGCL